MQHIDIMYTLLTLTRNQSETVLKSVLNIDPEREPK